MLKITYAKFTSNYIIPDNIVGMSLIFDLNISDLEESKELNVAPNSTESFDIKVTNSSSSKAYYGVWYKKKKINIYFSDIRQVFICLFFV